MTLDEVLERRLERVTAPGWASDAYLKLEYLGDEVSPMCNLVSPTAQKRLGRQTGWVELRLTDAFGKKNDWEEYNGPIAFKF